MKSLPIGLSTFRFLIEDGMVYVDKTGIIRPLVSVKGRYFLSRPRRFGKSLLVDTLKELFEGNESLFRGLAIYDSWDWSKEYAVLKIDFTGGTLRSKQDLVDKLMPILKRQAERFGASLTARGVSNRLHEVIQAMYDATGNPIVVLVDEYDKPLLDNIEHPERAMEIKTVQDHLPGGEGNPALEQVKAKGYAEKYTGQSQRAVFEVGLVFSRTKRNIDRFDYLQRQRIVE